MSETYEIIAYEDRAEWLRLRRQGIGASDIPAIMGVSPWSTPWQVWVSKVEEVPESEPSEDMEWGMKIEQLILDEAEPRLGLQLERGLLVRNLGWPWMMASPDGLGDGVVVEAKKVDEWSWPDGPPEHYRLQVQWQMAVTGCSAGWIAALHRGIRFALYPVVRDKALIESMIGAGEAFWQLVESGEPPPVRAADNEHLADLWPDHVEAAVEIPEELAAELRAAKEAEQLAKDRLSLAQAQVKALLGKADTAVVGQEVVATWRTQGESRLDVTALRAEEPQIAARFTGKSTKRVFRMKKQEES